MRRNPSSAFARDNLNQLQLTKFDYHLKGDYGNAKQLYNQILAIDKNNEWARTNLVMILPYLQ